MTKIAALTHVRKDDFFLAMWVDYYSKICGRSNLYVLLDGDDWTTSVDLSGVQTQVVTGREGLRIRDDTRLALAQTRTLETLFAQYDYVFRGDCDEFVCLDPKSNLDWPEALEETKEHGYIYCNGVDVIHDPANEPAYDPSRPVLAQRNYGVVHKFYFKPNIMSRPILTSSGGHRADGPVVVSNHFFMFHLANFDAEVFENRIKTRLSDAIGGTYDAHATSRRELNDALAGCDDPLEFDDGVARGRHQFSTRGAKKLVYRPQKFSEGNIVIDGHKGFLITLDARFGDIIWPS